jgi:hypothetical protein
VNQTDEIPLLANQEFNRSRSDFPVVDGRESREEPSSLDAPTVFSPFETLPAPSTHQCFPYLTSTP